MPNLALIILLAAFPALSTDMYLPAIPALQQLWGIPLAEANLSLLAFFASFSVFLLIYGPISDRFGRKPMMLYGIILYILGSWACALSGSIWQLVGARVVQGSGAAAASFMSLALAKDLYEGLERQKVLAYIGVIVPLCPMLAPMIGGWMLEFFSWRWIFGLQGASALVAIYGAVKLVEPQFERTSGGPLAVARRYLVLLGNRRYVIYTLVFSIMPISFFSYIGGSAAVYMNDWGMSAGRFGLYFGFNAFGIMLGSLATSRLCVGIEGVKILRVGILGIILGGVAVLVWGSQSPESFALTMFIVSFCNGLTRPLSNHMILEQVDKDVGAASAVMTFGLFMMAGLTMEGITLVGGNKIAIIGILAILGGSLPLATLLLLGRGDKRSAA